MEGEAALGLGGQRPRQRGTEPRHRDPDSGSQCFHPWASLENYSPLCMMLRKHPNNRNREMSRNALGVPGL